MDKDKKLSVQEVKADSLPIVIIYKGQKEVKEYILQESMTRTGLILTKK
jgi:hypothetical protein